MIEELRFSHRNIVTNLPIKLGELNSYVQEKYPNENLYVPQRVQIIPDEQLPTFFEVRGQSDFPAIEERFSPSGAYGVAYFLDECHLYFNARDWSTCSKKVLVYLSQHRHLKDNVWAITQAVEKLDKQFRCDAQSFIKCFNGYKQVVGQFKGLPRFRAFWYDENPGSSLFAKHFNSETYFLEPKGVGALYDTAAGYQMQGNHSVAGSEGAHTKAFPAWVLIPVILGISILLPVFIYFGSMKIQSLLVGENGEKSLILNQVQNDLRKKGVNVDDSESGFTSGIQHSLFGRNSSSIFVSGFFVKNGETFVLFSDGQLLAGENGLAVSPAFVSYEERKIPLLLMPNPITVSAAGSSSRTDFTAISKK